MAAGAGSAGRREEPMTTTGATIAPANPKRLTTSAMIASLAGEGQRTRPAPFGHALARLAEVRTDIVGMTADLAKYTDLHIFAQAHPDRFYQMGMAEQLLMSAAAGMAREGFVPFATTYAVFAARRAYDFICLAIAEEGLNVKIVAALPGLTTGYGPSHQATEDIAMFRGMPNLTIIDPCDAHEIEQIVPAIAAIAGLLLRSGITPTFRQIALPDEFLDAGALPTLHERYGISTEAMVRSIKAWQAQ